MDDRIWLVKIPKFVMEQWQRVSEELGAGVQLGTLRLYEPEPGRQKREISLHIPTADWSNDIPKNYNLHISNMNPQNEYVFTETKKGQVEGIVGQVLHEATLGPVNDDDYKRIMQMRTKAAGISLRTVEVIGEAAGRKINILNSKDNGGKGFSQGFGNIKPKATLDKKERMPKDDLLNVLFACFNKHTYWTFKGLVEHTQQPHAWLKEILGEICVLNKKGPYNGHYELKPEFQTQTS